jgi:glutamate-1-semialdehyde 2,1-aminomutase
MTIGEQYPVTATAPRSASSDNPWDRARTLIPGGVSRDQLFADPPLFATRGDGAYLFDTAGAPYVDFVNNYTSLIHGHGHQPTKDAIARQLSYGVSFGAPTPTEADLAEEILGRLPSADMIRFTNSGTEATMLALQVARFVTGRDRIAKFEGGYHGSHELLKVSVKPEDGGEREHPQPVPEEGSEGFDRTDVLPYDDVAAFERLAEEAGDTWAALIVEPMQGSAGMLPACTELLQACRTLADTHGFLLVFDEVMTFRHGGHGFQEERGVRPDLTALGKIIGGGLPVGALAGRSDMMGTLAPPRGKRIHHAGTFNGNPMTMRAGLAALTAYRAPEAQALDQMGERFRANLNAALSEYGLSVSGWGSMMNVHGAPEPPCCWRDVRDSDRQRIVRIQHRLLDAGQFIAARGMIVLSTAHTLGHLESLQASLVAAAQETAR